MELEVRTRCVLASQLEGLSSTWLTWLLPGADSVRGMQSLRGSQRLGEPSELTWGSKETQLKSCFHGNHEEESIQTHSHFSRDAR